MRPAAQRGFVLVQALIVLAGLLALMATLAANQRVSMNALQDRLRQRRAEAAARSAVAVALATLQNANPNLVTLSDEWAVRGENGDQAFELENALYRLEIIDAGSRINLNTATELQLQALPLTQEQLDSLLDWREATLNARPQGAKDDYYNTLPEPYNARLGRLNTLSELLLIKGWTARELYFPVDQTTITTVTPPQDDQGNPLPLAALLTVESGMPNTQVEGNPRTNISQGNLNAGALIQLGIDPTLADQIVARAPYSSFTELLSLPGMNALAAQRLLDDVTTTPSNRLEGKVNLNTASQSVLETVLGLSPDIASSIVSRQATGLQTLGEMATVPGLTIPQLAQIADSVGIGSDTWIVRAYGESGGVGVAIEAVVGIRNERVQIVSFERLSNTGVPVWWNWIEEPTVVGGSAGISSAGGGAQ